MHRLLPLLLLACSSPKSEPSAPVASGSAPAPIDAPVTVAPDADPFAGYPPRVAGPIGCTLRGAWKDQPRQLRFAAGGKPYVEVFGNPSAEVTFGGAAVFAELEAPSLRLAGFVDPKATLLHPAVAFVVADWLVPGPSAQLAFAAEQGGRIAFDVALPDGVKAKAPVRGERACAELAVDASKKFDPNEVLDDSQKEAMLHANRTIPLSIEPGKPPVAELRYKSSEAVEILDVRDKHVRVAVQVSSLNPKNNVVVFGWVPASAIHEKNTGFGGSWATGGDGVGGRRPPRKDSTFVACTSETPLVVDFGGEQRTVGVVLPKITIEVFAGGEDFVEVQLHRVHATLVDGARWLVKRAALAGCAETSRP
jgi:hypothetical protein